MKLFLRPLPFLIAAMFFLASCGGNESGNSEAEVGEEQTTAEASGKSFSVNTEKSIVMWTGSKAVGGSHSGTAKVSEGSLSFEGENLTGGSFTIDMKSLAETNAASEEMAGKLIGHLSSPDFFSVDSFPTAKLEITGAEATEGGAGTHNISANLTLKGTTKNITFPATVGVEGDMMKASAAFKINRADFNVRYGSGSFFDNLGDDLINDDVDIEVTISANAAEM